MGVQYFCAYQKGVVSSTPSFVMYNLPSFYFPHNFLPNFIFSPLPLPPTEHAAVILKSMSVTPDRTLPPPLLPIPHPIRFLCWPFLSSRQETNLLFGADHYRYTGGGTPSEVSNPPVIPYFAPAVGWYPTIKLGTRRVVNKGIIRGIEGIRTGMRTQ